MAKVKNTGLQPRGFFTDEGTVVTVPPGEEREFNMTEADYKYSEELAQMEDPPLYEISGGHGGVKKLNAKEQREEQLKKAEENAKKSQEDEKKRQSEAGEQKNEQQQKNKKQNEQA